jgi:hypothetical protein
MTMSSDPATQTTNSSKAPTAAELYRFAAFTAALFFSWTAWSAYSAPLIVIGLLVVLATGALAQKTNLAPIVFVTAFLLLEVFGSRPRSTPTRFVIVGSLLGVLIFNARVLAAQEPIRRQAAPKRGLWRTLTIPIRRLFGEEKPTMPPSPAGNMDEVIRLLLSILVAVVGGWLVLFYAPLDSLMRIRLGLPSGVVAAASVLLPFAVCLMLARTAFWFIDPKRKDPVLAEMELNELVWTELRPEMTRVGAFLGSAAAKQPELSTPVDDAKKQP